MRIGHNLYSAAVFLSRKAKSAFSGLAKLLPSLKKWKQENENIRGVPIKNPGPPPDTAAQDKATHQASKHLKPTISATKQKLEKKRDLVAKHPILSKLMRPDAVQSKGPKVTEGQEYVPPDEDKTEAHISKLTAYLKKNASFTDSEIRAVMEEGDISDEKVEAILYKKFSRKLAANHYRLLRDIDGELLKDRTATSAPETFEALTKASGLQITEISQAIQNLDNDTYVAAVQEASENLVVNNKNPKRTYRQSSVLLLLLREAGDKKHLFFQTLFKEGTADAINFVFRRVSDEDKEIFIEEFKALPLEERKRILKKEAPQIEKRASEKNVHFDLPEN